MKANIKTSMDVISCVHRLLTLVVTLAISAIVSCEEVKLRFALQDETFMYRHRITTGPKPKKQNKTEKKNT